MGQSQVSNHADTPLISLRNDPKAAQILVKKAVYNRLYASLANEESDRSGH